MLTLKLLIQRLKIVTLQCWKNFNYLFKLHCLLTVAVLL
ncbi:MAG: hypothetical protein OFPII_18010 [Osedax symbiont Rs1]|nr:MAG: hypothetical protein OFPII_18010 [Osedax symbiont Rs1]